MACTRVPIVILPCWRHAGIDVNVCGVCANGYQLVAGGACIATESPTPFPSAAPTRPPTAVPTTAEPTATPT
jgi:hypothetical protein